MNFCLTTKIKVLNKHGNFVSHVKPKIAHFSVKQEKSSWINETTIQVLYDKKDEQRFKKEAWVRDKYRCIYCDALMHPDDPELTIDHIEPKRRGGSILLHNLGTCCRSCNEQKGHRTLKQYVLNFYGGLGFMLLWWRNKERRMNSGNKEESRAYSLAYHLFDR